MSMYKKLVIFIWSLLGISVLSLILLFASIRLNAFGLFGGLPSLESLERPDPELSSELYSADGVSLGKYFRKNRTAVQYNELSQELITTLLVTEDLRYVKHSGIDLRGLIRAVVGKLTFSFKGGGSTITMQLAENLYGTSTENRGHLYDYPAIGQIITKLKEWIIAIQLESSYTKEEILAMYLNTLEYGSNSFGIKVAAQTFFNKLPSELNYKESAVIVGLINKPTAYNPVLYPDRARGKRTEILYNLYKYGEINRAKFDSLKGSEFDLQYKVANQNQGPATYFRSVIRDFLMKWCKENGYDLFADGLKIYTTIDSRMQQYAEEALGEHMKSLQNVFIKHLAGSEPWIDHDGNVILDYLDNAIKKTPNYKLLVAKYGEESDSLEYYLNLPRPMSIFTYNGEIDTTFSLLDSLAYYKHFLHAGFMAMDPATGHIKSWVGGINHKHFKFDHVQRGRRQPGSTFKPFVYAAAIDLGYSPCFPVVDAPVTWVLNEGDTWTPENADGKYSGETMTMRRAMASSVNSITAWVMQKISPRAAVDMAKNCGIMNPLSAVPSLCLGAGGDVSVYEMVGAYSTFVNKGTWTQPFYITRIEDENGVVLEEFIPKRREAISERTAYLMLHMLKGALEERGGTGHGLDAQLKSNNEIGAKTGTTQRASDGWFMGVTKDLVAGAWVGGDDRSIHFKNWFYGQGARTAMPIWNNFMLKVYEDPRTGVSKGKFDRPTVPLGVELNCDMYSSSGSLQSDSLGTELEELNNDLQDLLN